MKLSPGVLLLLALAFGAGKATGGFHLFGSNDRRKKGERLARAPVPTPNEPMAIPVATSTAAPFPSVAPTGLRWPKDWKSKQPVTQADVSRTWALNDGAAMKLNSVKYEQGPDGWLAYYRYRDPKTKKINVSVYVPRRTGTPDTLSVRNGLPVHQGKVTT